MTGGTGFLGSALRERLEQRGDRITCVSRSKTGVVNLTTFVSEDHLNDLPPHDAVINLAGESVVGLWTRSKREAIYHSRVDLTHRISAWISESQTKPSVYLSGSAVGIYGDSGDREVAEGADVSGAGGFLAKVCRDWEAAAFSAAWRGTRTVLLRTGQVLDPGGGYLKAALPMMRRFPIVILGSPKSYFPWISLDDWIGLALWALDGDEVNGPLNMVAPTPTTQGRLTQGIARILGKRVWGHIPRWMLRLGAGEFGASIAASQRVLPAKATSAGYQFGDDTIEDYLDSIHL